jgi:hypothetical protein
MNTTTECSLWKNKWWNHLCLIPSNLNWWVIYSQGRYGQTQVFQTKPTKFTNVVHYHMLMMMPNLCSQTWKIEHTFRGTNVLGTLFAIHRNTTSTQKHWTHKRTSLPKSLTKSLNFLIIPWSLIHNCGSIGYYANMYMAQWKKIKTSVQKSTYSIHNLAFMPPKVIDS